MTAELSKDVTADLGQHLLGRAAAPGVIRPGLATRIQRRSVAGGAGLAAEIQRRWAPAASAAWGHGSDLPYLGFGGPGAAAGTGPGSEGPSRAVPKARTVGAATVSPAAQALSGLGSSLQRRHTGGRGSGAVQRRAILIPQEAPGVAVPPLLGGGEGGSGGGEGEGQFFGGQPLVQRRAATAEQPPRSSAPSLQLGVEVGPAIVRRSAVQRVAEASAETPPASIPTVSAPPRSTEPVVAMGPAIVHRAAGRSAVQRVSLPQKSGPARRESSPPGPLSHLPPTRSPGEGETLLSGGAFLPLPRRGEGGRWERGPGGEDSPRRSLPSGTASPTTAGSSVQRTMIQSSAPAAALPLARPIQPAIQGGGTTGTPVIQRCEFPRAAAANQITPTAPTTPAEPPKPPKDEPKAADPSLDLEEVVERVMRRLSRSLTIESERHGGRRWP